MAVTCSGPGRACSLSDRLLTWRRRLVVACSTDPLLAPVRSKGSRRRQIDHLQKAPSITPTAPAVYSAAPPVDNPRGCTLPPAYQPSPKRPDVPAQAPAGTLHEPNLSIDLATDPVWHSANPGLSQSSKQNLLQTPQSEQLQQPQQQPRRLTREERQQQKQERILAHKRKSIWHIPDADASSSEQQQQQLNVRVARVPRGPQAAFKTMQSWRAASGLPASGGLPSISKDVYRKADVRRFNPPPYAPEDPIEFLQVGFAWG